jgi:hypothetical protein
MFGRLFFSLLAAYISFASCLIGPHHGTEDYHWVNSWVAMPQIPEYTNLPGSGYYNQSNLVFPNSTLRQTIQTSIGGKQIRLRISNQFGAVNLPITAVTVA